MPAMAIFFELPVKNKILLLSGTSEGPVLARALSEAGFQVRATVTRPEARENLFGNLQNIQAEVRGFTEETLGEFLRAGNADIVLDATHPFAVRITRIAHAVCARVGVPYVRYERPDWQPPAGTLFADSFPQAAAVLPGLGRRIMLTIGAKQLKHFSRLHDQLTLFARILPSQLSREQATAAGFSAEQLVCQRPPFTQADNQAVFQHLRTEVLVTKASGSQGGVVEKVLAAGELGMEVLMIRRPNLPEIQAVSSVEQALASCLACREKNK
jgi:precorrin-6A/cobalt-precorrin-6A reductase